MTEQEMRIAVAESLGWHDIIKSSCGTSGYAGLPPDVSLYHLGCKGSNRRDLPNCPQDLNAMHEVERTLTGIERREYYEVHLPSVTGFGINSLHHQNTQRTVSATALQRCEAYLRVKGLWKESTPNPSPGDC